MVETSDRNARVCFVEMMGKPGSYDASVYDDLEDGDKEGVWFQKNYGSVPGIHLFTTNVCIGEPLPSTDQVDGLVLAGTYNSVHDNTEWQEAVRQWIPKMRAQRIPMLNICGSHQLIAHQLGSNVVRYSDGPFAGTFPVQLTEAGVKSPIMQSIQNDDCFHYANSEHVTEIPKGSTLLASSSKVPVAALDFGNHCYSTQFHPEATVESLGTIWKNTSPTLCDNYHAEQMGDVLVRNFLNLVVSQCRSK